MLQYTFVEGVPTSVYKVTTSDDIHWLTGFHKYSVNISTAIDWYQNYYIGGMLLVVHVVVGNDAVKIGEQTDLKEVQRVMQRLN